MRTCVGSIPMDRIPVGGHSALVSIKEQVPARRHRASTLAVSASDLARPPRHSSAHSHAGSSARRSQGWRRDKPQPRPNRDRPKAHSPLTPSDSPAKPATDLIRRTVKLRFQVVGAEHDEHQVQRRCASARSPSAARPHRHDLPFPGRANSSCGLTSILRSGQPPSPPLQRAITTGQRSAKRCSSPSSR